MERLAHRSVRAVRTWLTSTPQDPSRMRDLVSLLPAEVSEMILYEPYERGDSRDSFAFSCVLFALALSGIVLRVNKLRILANLPGLCPDAALSCVVGVEELHLVVSDAATFRRLLGRLDPSANPVSSLCVTGVSRHIPSVLRRIGKHCPNLKTAIFESSLPFDNLNKFAGMHRSSFSRTLETLWICGPVSTATPARTDKAADRELKPGRFPRLRNLRLDIARCNLDLLHYFLSGSSASLEVLASAAFPGETFPSDRLLALREFHAIFPLEQLCPEHTHDNYVAFMEKLVARPHTSPLMCFVVRRSGVFVFPSEVRLIERFRDTLKSSGFLLCDTDAFDSVRLLPKTKKLELTVKHASLADLQRVLTDFEATPRDLVLTLDREFTSAGCNVAFLESPTLQHLFVRIQARGHQSIFSQLITVPFVGQTFDHCPRLSSLRFSHHLFGIPCPPELELTDTFFYHKGSHFSPEFQRRT